MSTAVQNTAKTLEVKVRESNMTQRMARVYLTKEALLELNIEIGGSCYLWKDADVQNTKQEAVAWNTAQKNVTKDEIQITKEFKAVCGFKDKDILKVSAGHGRLRVAEVVTVVEIVKQEPQAECDRLPYQCILENECFRVKEVFPSQIFEKITFKGVQRTFKVYSVNGSTDRDIYHFGDSSSVKINTIEELSGTQVEKVEPLAISNIEGIDKELAQLNRFLARFYLPIDTWARMSNSVLIHGGPGTGKTFLMDKVANTGWGKVHRIESDAKPTTVKDIFREAKGKQPSIIIIDDLEHLATRLDKVLSEELDDLVHGHPAGSVSRVVVIAATSDIGSIPKSLLDLGRFDKTILLPVPDTPARKAILKSMNIPIDPNSKDEILERLGERTHAYTPKDLRRMLLEAWVIANDRWGSAVHAGVEQPFFILPDEINQALALVGPSAMNDITLQPPVVKWEDIGGQDQLKEDLRIAIEEDIKEPERAKRHGAAPTKGILLYGPPGCSKTLIAQAVATNVGFNFIAVKGAELLNMYLGESERAVRAIFTRARAASPCVIFFDEIESIGSARDGKTKSTEVLTTLLNEMDGIEVLKDVLVLAATNQPWALDLALLRPGRFDKLFYVAPPDLAGREDILRVKFAKMYVSDSIDIKKLARKTKGYSGAELVGICHAAIGSAKAREREKNEKLRANMEDFEKAIKGMKKQITPRLIRKYETWKSGPNTAKKVLKDGSEEDLEDSEDGLEDVLLEDERGSNICALCGH